MGNGMKEGKGGAELLLESKLGQAGVKHVLCKAAAPRPGLLRCVLGSDLLGAEVTDHLVG